MPRKLPWLIKPDGTKADSKPVPSPRAPRKRKTEHESDESDGFSEADLDEPLWSPKKTKTARCLSSSPPPAPPREEYMIAGYDADDRWRMVEDEFFSTARLFTAHLHHAEYKRLKKLAEPQQQREIDRSIDTRTEESSLSKMTKLAKKQRGKTNDALDKIFGSARDEDEVDLDEDPFMKDSRLAALMGGNEQPIRLEQAIVRRPPAQPAQNRGLAAQTFDNPLLRKQKAPTTRLSGEPGHTRSNLSPPSSPPTPSGRSLLPPIKSRPTIPESKSLWIGIGKTAKVYDYSEHAPLATKASEPLAKSNQRLDPFARPGSFGDDFWLPYQKKNLPPRVAARLAKLKKNSQQSQSAATDNKANEQASLSSKNSDIPTFLF